MKYCPNCKRDLPEEFYYVAKTAKTGRRKICCTCFNEQVKAYRRSIPGIITQIWSSQKKNSRVRNHPQPSYTRKEFSDWFFRQPKLMSLYNAWVQSGYKRELSVSVDRINSQQPYSLDNIQMVKFQDNFLSENIEMKQGKIGRCKPVTGTFIRTGEKLTFPSASIAGRKLGLHKSHISACARGVRYSTGGYNWRYR